MNSPEVSSTICVGSPGALPKRQLGWAFCELAIGYGLILAVIWTAQPFQRWFYWISIAWFACAISSSFPGWKEMGCSIAGFWRSLWVPALALILAGAAMATASSLHTLHHPVSLSQWIFAFGGYTLWSLAQQFLLQGYFLMRLIRLLPSAALAAVSAAVIFALAHLPNPILTALTLVWGLVACFVFLRSRNLWTLAIAHAILGISVAVTVPGTVLHNMRVGLGYLTYHAPYHFHRNHSDHRVSTVAWVMDEAPTRR